MATPLADDGAPAGAPGGDAPFLPPARPAVPVLPAAPPIPTVPPTAPTAPPAAAPVFDAAALVESQRRHNPNPAYGSMPAGTDESRAAARKLREDANRKRRRGKATGRIVVVLLLAGLAAGGYLAYQAIQDDPPPLTPPADGAAGTGGGSGALTPVGEQQQVIDALDDLTSGAAPSAGGLLGAVEQARDVVGQSAPPVAPTLAFADVFTTTVLEHTTQLDPADGWERLVVRGPDLAAADPAAHAALVERLVSLPVAAEGDSRLTAAPVVLPGDIGLAIVRDGERIVTIAVVATDPPLRAIGP